MKSASANSAPVSRPSSVPSGRFGVGKIRADHAAFIESCPESPLKALSLEQGPEQRAFERSAWSVAAAKLASVVRASAWPWKSASYGAPSQPSARFAEIRILRFCREVDAREIRAEVDAATVKGSRPPRSCRCPAKFGARAGGEFGLGELRFRENRVLQEGGREIGIREIAARERGISRVRARRSSCRTGCCHRQASGAWVVELGARKSD